MCKIVSHLEFSFAKNHTQLFLNKIQKMDIFKVEIFGTFYCKWISKKDWLFVWKLRSFQFRGLFGLRRPNKNGRAIKKHFMPLLVFLRRAYSTILMVPKPFRYSLGHISYKMGIGRTRPLDFFFKPSWNVHIYRKKLKKKWCCYFTDTHSKANTHINIWYNWLKITDISIFITFQGAKFQIWVIFGCPTSPTLKF